ncbi:MAG: 2-isopropylmalate synthase [Omnitrophica bacterium RIFCSPHIGHO2_02_FULL_46_11]|nr:MAG: 2-isopropylmalate synthase [Omnitrophica bacterium RIFCSPHIGHO2_02_FULL_46_11]OGW87628.1 MAG: 2-isopropylmalate synthase [Omnitrophica bacterium RIFCSPLOWO2_01_FULL_45_10b]
MKSSARRKIYVFDTTLRDGEQCPGASLTPDEKLEIAKQLERLNVDIIEAGFPAASAGEVEAIQKISKAVKTPVICALSRMVPKDIDLAREALKFAKKKRLHVFLATSKIHREYKLRKRKSEILKLAVQNIKYGKKFFDDVEFSPEDAARTERAFLAEVVQAGIDAGATTVNVPDTVGYSMPIEFGDLIAFLIKKSPALGKKVNLSVHCHNDLGLAVANSLAAIQNGANQVECTVNGIGERAGNASLEEIAMGIDTRRDLMNAYTNINLKEITKSSRLISHLTGLVVQPNKAIVGRNAFAHESGIHQDGLLKMRQTYEIIDPKRIGLSGSEIVMGKHSGRHAFRERLQKLGIKLDAAQLDQAFERFKELSDQKKYIFDKDLEAIAEDQISQIPETWQFEFLKIASETGSRPEAAIRLKREGKVTSAASDGDGPVDACYRAIEKITGIKARLTHYAIQSVTSGKDALGEVNIKAVIEGHEVSGRGTSTDVIEASVKAYLFALNKVYARIGKKPISPI